MPCQNASRSAGAGEQLCWLALWTSLVVETWATLDSHGIEKVLVLNAGSSSLKFKLFDEAKNKLFASVSGLIERIGDTSNSQVTPDGQRFRVCCDDLLQHTFIATPSSAVGAIPHVATVSQI